MPSSPASVFNSFRPSQKAEYTIISSSQAHDKNELQTTGNPTELKSSLLKDGHFTLLKKRVGKKKNSICWLQSGNLYCLATAMVHKIPYWGNINPLRQDTVLTLEVFTQGKNEDHKVLFILILFHVSIPWKITRMQSEWPASSTAVPINQTV